MTRQRPQFAVVDTYTLRPAHRYLIVARTTTRSIRLPVAFGRSALKAGTTWADHAPTHSSPAQQGRDFACLASSDNETRSHRPLARRRSLPSCVHNVRRADPVYFVFFIYGRPLHPLWPRGFAGTRFDVTPWRNFEDMQVAYGVDANGDGRVTRTAATTATDTDLNMSSQDNGDEWVPNTSGETTPYTTVQFQSDAAPGTFPHPLNAAHCPRLHAVMVSLVAKSRDPDPTYRGTASFGFRVMNVPGIAGPPFVPTPPLPDFAGGAA